MSKALIVDDSRTDAYVSQKCADQLFDEVKVVGTLQELLQVVPSFKPDVIFMDVYLGEWHNGLSHIRELRSGQGELSITPIIVLSSKAAEEDKRLAVEAGAAGYIVKPATLDNMRESLRRYVPGFIPKGWESVIA
ncbi:response regulator [Pseudomonas aeruginosa]|uniref:response regulator n=1 Tax=Pseudomonas aeruginosa TaxID=287 RepID=UPI0024ACBFAE|nr:response regulator [Pseudomonas aeruginosa]MDI6671969.1 response regulator [Pseudomonas aeruginosa]